MSKAREWPRGWQIPGPRAVQNLQMPLSSPRGEGGGGWAQVELTDALSPNCKGFTAAQRHVTLQSCCARQR